MNLQNQTKQIVLLWLATSDSSGEPNVSPKELFLFKGKDRLIVANIASPKTLTNILQNPKVCISGIDIWKQKGMQYKGRAKVISSLNKRFKKIEAEFRPLNQGKFRIQHFIEIQIFQQKEVSAPSYFFYPTTEEEDQIEVSKTTYFKQLPGQF